MHIAPVDIHNQLATAKLPSLPQVLLALLALCDEEGVGMAEIAAAVSKDAGIAARVVGAANSPLYSPSRSLDTLNQCLSILGTNTVRRMALNQSVAELFGRFQKSRDYDLRHFWFHSLSVAVTARHLALRLGYPNLEEAYLAGLLHDVGQLALLATVPDRYLPLFKNFSGEHALMDAEQSTFGLTHAEVGAWLAERWKLHGILVDAILYHHEGLERVRQAHPLVQVVMLANLFNSRPEAETTLSETDLAHWHLDTLQARTLAAEAQQEARGIAAELGVELPAVTHPLPEAGQADEAGAGDLADSVAQRLEALLDAPEADVSPDGTLQDLLRSAGLLWGSRGSALFLPEGEALRWWPGENAPARSDEIRVDGTSAESRIALAYHGRIGLAGQQAGDHLADLQVLRLLGGDRLLCLPLVFAGHALGVLVVGLDLAGVEYYTQRHILLATFAQEAGKSLGLALRRQSEVKAAREDLARDQELRLRKLVHEANNPLGVIRNYLAILKQQLAEQPQAQEDFGLMEEEIRRVSRILQQVRQVAAGTVPAGARTSRVDLNLLIKEVIQFCRLGKPELARVEVAFTPIQGLPAFLSEADKLKQILTNLIFNAAEALEGSGRIGLSLSFWRAGMGRNMVEITVEDNGPGLPDAVLAQLYQPVPTNKGENHSGLGLSIIAGLVTEIGGQLQCHSGPEGTRFKIQLPVDQATS